MKGIVARIAIDRRIPPVAQAPRKIPVSLEPLVMAKVLELEAKGLVSKVEGHSRWQSPVVLAKKKDDGLRLCVDMRLPNLAVLKETYPMISLEMLTSKLSGATVFSKLDIKEAFHQVRIDDEASELTTFMTPAGLYRYNVLMFGMSTATETFQRLLNNEVLAGLQGVVCSVDDLLIYGEDQETHDVRLGAVLDRFESLNVRLNEK